MVRKTKKHGKRRVGRVAKRKQAARVERVAERVAESGDASGGEVNASGANESKDTILGAVQTDNSMNNVEVNEAALIAEAERAVSNAPADQLQPVEGELQTASEVNAESQASAEDIKKGYTIIVGAMLAGASESLAPNWAVQTSEIDPLADAIADACLLWFPDTPIPPKYLALLVVANAALNIVKTRRDPQTGMLKPLHANAKQESNAQPTQREAV
jgi:hypothetical protein